jgi:hypothetical protein
MSCNRNYNISNIFLNQFTTSKEIIEKTTAPNPIGCELKGTKKDIILS